MGLLLFGISSVKSSLSEASVVRARRGAGVGLTAFGIARIEMLLGSHSHNPLGTGWLSFSAGLSTYAPWRPPALPPSVPSQRAGAVALCTWAKRLYEPWAFMASDRLAAAVSPGAPACGARAADEVLNFSLITGGLLLPL